MCHQELQRDRYTFRDSRDSGLDLLALGSAIVLIMSHTSSAAGPVRSPTGSLQLVSRQGHSGRVTSATLSRDGSFALTASSDKTAILWDGTTGRALRHFVARAPLRSAALSPDDKYVVAG